MHHAGAMIDNIRHAVVVTGFVFAMMTLVDYVNVVTGGKFGSFFRRGKKRQYVGSSLLGAVPGCLGAFAVTSLYAHRMLSFGAIVACMLATSGDEAFVMLALFPGTALLIFTILFALGLLWGWLCEHAASSLGYRPCEGCELLEVHEENLCAVGFSKIGENLARLSLARFCLFCIIAFFVYAVAAGGGAHGEPAWMTVTLLALLAGAAFVAVTAPEHYLEFHLWEHLAKRHLWKIFLWVAGTMLAIHYLTERWNLEGFVSGHSAWMLPIAVLVGLIPQSGPHLVFVVMYWKGLVPFSVLLASCISQEGHGMLPLLSVSVRDFVWVKVSKLCAGLLVGYLAYWAGI